MQNKIAVLVCFFMLVIAGVVLQQSGMIGSIRGEVTGEGDPDGSSSEPTISDRFCCSTTSGCADTVAFGESACDGPSGRWNTYSECNAAGTCGTSSEPAFSDRFCCSTTSGCADTVAFGESACDGPSGRWNTYSDCQQAAACSVGSSSEPTIQDRFCCSTTSGCADTVVFGESACDGPTGRWNTYSECQQAAACSAGSSESSSGYVPTCEEQCDYNCEFQPNGQACYDACMSECEQTPGSSEATQPSRTEESSSSEDSWYWPF